MRRLHGLGFWVGCVIFGLLKQELGTEPRTNLNLRLRTNDSHRTQILLGALVLRTRRLTAQP